jgi:hypothetical protein
MPVETRFWLAGEGDAAGFSGVFAAAYNNLYSKRGMLDAPLNPRPPNPVFASLIRKTPDAFWVPEEDGRIIASSHSFVGGRSRTPRSCPCLPIRRKRPSGR